MRTTSLLTAAVILILTACGSPGRGQQPPLPRAAVSTADPIATEIGIQVLRKGGNATDAAVAIGFALPPNSLPGRKPS